MTHFNCTIQELKPIANGFPWSPSVFQLHHTGIKTGRYSCSCLHNHQFQLHHTGIKTKMLGQVVGLDEPFQLHHTGIKTTLEDAKAIADQDISIAPYRN